MCSPASFVITKDEVFWSKKNDSHEDIIEEFGIHVDGVRGPNAVRVEISPDDGDLSRPLKEWTYRLDQKDYPKWYEPKEAEKRCRVALKEWAKAKLFLNGAHNVRDGEVYAYGSSQVTAYGSSHVTACDSSQVKAYDSSQVTAYGSSQVTAYDSSHVTACEHNATVNHYATTEPVQPTGPQAVVIDRRGPKAICIVGE